MSRHAARPPGDRADLDWCHEAVQGVSRTFALTVDVLDEPMASYICIGYLLCRVPDTVEDADHIPPADQARLLSEYDCVLDPDDDTDADTFRASVDEWLPAPDERNDDWEVVASTPRILRTFRALPDDVCAAVTPPARELVQGMAMFVERYADEGRRARLYDTAEEFGLLLQLVNVAKDVYDDFTEEDNVYLPEEWLAAEGVPQELVLDPGHRSGAAAVVRRTARHARSFLDDAQTYLETVPTTDGNTVAAWAIPFLLAVGTLRELLARPEDALSETGVKISRQEVFAVVTEMTGTDATAPLGDLREDIAGQPLHRASGRAD